jgi:hypothetical protein
MICTETTVGPASPPSPAPDDELDVLPDDELDVLPDDELDVLPDDELDDELGAPPWPPVPEAPEEALVLPPVELVPDPHAPIEKNGPSSAATRAAPSRAGRLVRFEVFESLEEDVMLTPS